MMVELGSQRTLSSDLFSLFLYPSSLSQNLPLENPGATLRGTYKETLCQGR